ncbi:hypothetical protein N781_08755 [Pontibacillus halophilus JSM 076056 = DSM 19796]|uniref:Glycosyl transferase family 1 n=1 Tax=Pontibacillus halophilus JSM 076056 = DSM 19796 TaxID=1385510 RepID=A0A0A5GFK0_9BACI|nr:glycosyltransferase family 4 protein [Pontibacillus halophilus]KGX89983.1 hypothetical protein N781_08755 [Pontibacillus halophilus JSM 076056 = DSM 19796]
MDVLYILDDQLITGGAQISTSIIGNHLSEEGLRIGIITPKLNTNLIELNPNIELYEVSKFSRFPNVKQPLKILLLMKELRRLINSLEPKVIHTQMVGSSVAVSLLKKFGLIPRGTKLIYSNREQFESYHRVIKTLLRNTVAKEFNVIVCTTNVNANDWKEFVENENVVIIPNTTGYLYKNYDTEQEVSVKKQYNININDMVIGFVGRMNEVKNWPLAVEISQKYLQRKNRKVIFVIGANSEGEFEKANEITSSLKEEFGDKFVFFINKNQEEMSKIYYLMDILVVTSNMESFGRMAIEAMSRKCAVLSRDVGGLTEVVERKSNLLEANSISFINMLDKYYRNPDLLKKDKEWFYDKYDKKYSSKQHFKLYNELYERFL